MILLLQRNYSTLTSHQYTGIWCKMSMQRCIAQTSRRSFAPKLRKIVNLQRIRWWHLNSTYRQRNLRRGNYHWGIAGCSEGSAKTRATTMYHVVRQQNKFMIMDWFDGLQMICSCFALTTLNSWQKRVLGGTVEYQQTVNVRVPTHNEDIQSCSNKRVSSSLMNSTAANLPPTMLGEWGRSAHKSRLILAIFHSSTWSLVCFI